MKLENYLNESGIRGIKDLAKEYKEAEIYFHIDLDGVTSAICMKEYLKQYGIKTVNFIPIQYGEMEYQVEKPTPGLLHVIVDFAHGKGGLKGDLKIHIHTDHHDKQAGVDPSTKTSFVHSPSNAAHLSATVSPKEIFSAEDIRIISTVDSANFSSQGITPDDVMRSAFKVNKEIDVNKNHMMMGLVTNKLLLAYKNKKNFLKDLIILSKPSLFSMFNNIIKLAKAAGYVAPEEIKGNQEDFVSRYKESENFTVNGNVATQYAGGSSMLKGGSYDRYTAFKVAPDIDWLISVWPMGLIQLSKNPFKKGTNPYHLGNICQKVLSKFKSKLEEIKINFLDLKIALEKQKNWKRIKAEVAAGAPRPNPVGFGFEDFEALFGDKVKNKNFREILVNISQKKGFFLSDKQKELLRKVEITAWDLIQAQSGGHKDISNLSGWNFIPNYLPLMKEVVIKLEDEMKDKSLEK